MKHATAAERQAWCWLWAKRLFIRWHTMHGLGMYEEAWELQGDWGRCYWYGVAEFVYDNFDEKVLE